MKITKDSGGFTISFRFNPNTLIAVKQLSGRRFNDRDKTWFVPLQSETEVLAFAKAHRVKIIDVEQIRQKMLEVPPLPELTVDIPLRMPLYPFQRQGVAYAMEKKRLIIGDQPGLGKTAQAIATVIGADAFPCLVICPSSLKINWQREFAMWGNERAIILDDSNRNRWPMLIHLKRARVFLVNYESLKKFFVESIDRSKERVTLREIKFNGNIEFFKSVIVDESHRCKNFNALQTKFVRGIAAKKEYVLCLTGTPVVNSPKDLLPQLGIIDRYNEFGGYPAFKQRYVDLATPEMHDELSAMLRIHCFYRREKHDVLKDLPAKQRQMVMCEITNRKEYSEAENDVIEYLRKWKNADSDQLERAMRGEIMVRINHLKQISARGKMEAAFEFIDEVVEAGEKIIVFAHHREILHMVIERYSGKCRSITGEDSNEERQAAVDAFQNLATTQVIVCSIKAAGVGLTLTAASRVAFIELAWHPADHEQCEDRAHRIGQADSVQCIYFIGRGTYDEEIYRIINEKRDMSNRITGANDNTSEQVFASLLEVMVDRIEGRAPVIAEEPNELNSLFP